MPDGVRFSPIGPYIFACDRPAGMTLIGSIGYTMADDWSVHGGSDLIQSKVSTNGSVQRSVTAIFEEPPNCNQSEQTNVKPDDETRS